jgi:hypothetical protein
MTQCCQYWIEEYIKKLNLNISDDGDAKWECYFRTFPNSSHGFTEHVGVPVNTHFHSGGTILNLGYPDS